MDAAYIAERLTFAIPRPDGTVLAGHRDGVQGRDPEVSEARSALYRMVASRSIDRVTGGVSISNGLGCSHDGGLFYFIDSRSARVDVFRRDSATGAIADRQELVTVDDGLPDGLTVDVEGYIWVAPYGEDSVHRYSLTGELNHVVELLVRLPTRCEFAGLDLNQLLITASYAQLERLQEAGPLDGQLIRVATDTRSLPLWKAGT